jgi:hypothetical protein
MYILSLGKMFGGVEAAIEERPRKTFPRGSDEALWVWKGCSDAGGGAGI